MRQCTDYFPETPGPAGVLSFEMPEQADGDVLPLLRQGAYWSQSLV